MSLDLERRVKVYREKMGDDLLGATFFELLLRLDETDPRWIEANTYAFYMQLSAVNPKAEKAFNQGLVAALREIKRRVKNG